ncbi:MAG: MATE family efflux transporter [Solobacterium sp.]|nr:MATE family efflux transporter [Solobacterium sp.]
MKLLKDRTFLNSLKAVMLPITLQYILNYAVSITDSVMVGSLGDLAVTAVTQATQPYTLFYTFLYGLGAGGTVLISQYWGKQDIPAIRNLMGLLYRIVIAVCVFWCGLCILFPAHILGFFTNSEAVVETGLQYFRIAVLAYPLTAMTVCYFNGLKGTEDVKYATAVYAASSVVNVAANAVLIYGLFGCPAMGVRGAALGTLIARAFEFLNMLYYAAYREDRICFRLRDILHIDTSVLPVYIRTSIPVLGNDLLWGLGGTMQVAIFGNLGETMATATSVAAMMNQLAMVLVYGAANAAAVLVGKQTGTGDEEKAWEMGKTFLILGVIIGVLTCCIVLLARWPFLMLYPNITDSSRLLASQIILVIAFLMVLRTLENICIIGVLRGSGDTRTAFLIDMGCQWLIGLPLGYLSAFVWKWPVLAVYAIMCTDICVKDLLCIRRILKGNYIHNLTEQA